MRGPQPNFSHRWHDPEARFHRRGPWSYVVGTLAAGALIVGGVLALGWVNLEAPTSPTADLTDAQVSAIAQTWVNNTDVGSVDAELWRDRLEAACTRGVWDVAKGLPLAANYLAEDLDDTLPDTPRTRSATDALWTMAVQVCRDDFPAAAIEAGPPFMG